MRRAAAAPIVALAYLLDALALVLAVAIVAIAITGGGIFDVGGTRISARSVGNPLAALLLIGLIRYALAGAPASLATRCASLVRGTHHWLAALTPPRAWRIVLALAFLTLAVKLANAWGHPGFFSGDDVEVQEMSLAALFDVSWPAWTLRSAFFPMVFIHPAHAVVASLGPTGTTDPGVLVAAGRTVVAVLSTLTVIFVFVGARRHDGIAPGILAAFLAATSHLLVSFGGTELPRPIAAALIAGAFALLLHRSTAASMLGGVLVGIAAALRFSEAVFVAPAVGMLVFERRWRDAVVCLVAAAGAALAIQAVSDQLYWGTPFYSVRQAIDYTLVERQSTRGFQPPWHYLTTIPEWSDFAIVAMAVFAAVRGAWRPALWAGVPLLVLSVLPHKEARYLIPIVPFVSMLAGAGLWRLIVRASSPGAMPPWSSIAIVGGVIASTLMSINGYHVRRSDAAVSLARSIAGTPGVSSVAVEQLWRWGGRIYLRGVPALQELDGRLARPEDLATLAQDTSISILALRTETCARLGCAEALRGAGLEERVSAESSDAEYRVFSR